MMGCYIAQGLPLYFVNRQMLNTLGYDSEQEFISDVGGMLTNCIHPRDRKLIRDTNELLEKLETYAVEYRLKKEGRHLFMVSRCRAKSHRRGRASGSVICLYRHNRAEKN